MPDVRRFAVDPIEAIALYRDKLHMPTRMWTDIWEQMHARAFVVAGAQSDALIADFYDAIMDALNGGTLASFQKDFDRIVAKHGWNYRGTRNWRSRVIFETNLRMAYSAGRWAQIQRVKRLRPYIRYVHVDPQLTQKNSRPDHAALHNLVLPVDDPFWDHYFPPNGWGCRCSVQSLSERDLKRYGLTVSESPTIEWTDRTVNTADGPVTVRVPKGIAPGFAYNVGKAGFGRGAQSLVMESGTKWHPLEAPGAELRTLRPLPIDKPKIGPLSAAKAKTEAQLREALRSALGGDEAIITDPTGARVRLTQAIVDHLIEHPDRFDGRERYFPILRDLVEDPAEIWVGFAINEVTGRSAIRRRYVKLIDLGKGRYIGLVADAEAHEWIGFTFFTGTEKAGRLRGGNLLFRRGDVVP